MCRAPRAFTMVETMVAMIVLSLILTGIVMLLRGVVKNIGVTASAQHASAEMGRFFDQLQADASSSIAVFVPATDVKGTTNADGHEVDFYSRNGQANPVFWAYTFTAGSSGKPGSIQKYTYAWGTRTSAPMAVGNPITGISTFRALSQSASSIVSPMFTGHSPPIAHDLTTNYAGVISGNHVTLVIASTGGANVETRAVRLMAGILPNGQKAVVATWTPVPSRALSVSPDPMSFSGPTAPAQTFLASDDPYYVAAFLQNSNCAGIVNISPAGTVQLASNGSSNGQVRYTVTPNAAFTTGGSCTVTLTDQFNQTASETITVAAAPPGPISVNPVTIEGPPPGGQLAFVSAPFNGVGDFQLAAIFWLAQAAGGTCGVNGFRALDANKNVVTSGSAWGLNIDANGCITGNTTSVYQSNYRGAFTYASGTCGNTVALGNWSPSNSGPGYASFAVGSNTSAQTSCQISVGGATTGVQNVYVGPDQCLAVNDICSLNAVWPSGSPGCDPSTGSASSDYTGLGRYALSGGTGNGTIVNNADGTGTFTRTVVGTVSISEQAQYQTWTAVFKSSGGYTCTSKLSYVAFGTITLN